MILPFIFLSCFALIPLRAEFIVLLSCFTRIPPQRPTPQLLKLRCPEFVQLVQFVSR